jgi:molecular chaperone GrpE (heat shock protein)
MLEVRAAAAGADAKPLTKAIDGFVNQIGPTVDTFKSVAGLTSDLPLQARTACLNSLPFESGSARVLYLEALLDVVGPTLLDGQDPWQKVTTRELASGWADDHPVITAMVESDCGRKAAISAIRKDLDGMDGRRLGLLLDLHPDIRAVITDEIFVKALVRLMKRNPNVAKLPELVAQPLINSALEEFQQQKSVLQDRQRELEAGFREQVSERDDQITDLERELEQARRRIASRTNEVRGALDAELRQAVIETLKGCAQMVTNLQKVEGNEAILEKLEQALKEAGLVVLDQPGEIVAFDAVHHERLGEGSSLKVKVVLSAIGYAEGESVSIIRKGSVRNVG